MDLGVFLMGRLRLVAVVIKMLNVIRNQRGGSTGDTIVGVVVFGLIIFGVLAVIGYFSGGMESEGIVKYDDCRQILTIKEGSGDTFGKKFTCEYIRSKSGKLMSGTCVHIDTENGVCTTAYVYEKKSEFNCGDNSTPNYDDSVYACSCNDGYHADPKDNRKPCIVDSPTPNPAQNTTDPNPFMVSPTPTMQPKVNWQQNDPSVQKILNQGQ